MKSIEPPEAAVILEQMAPATRLIQEAVDVGIQKTVEFFENLDKPVDPFLAPDLVRYYAMLLIEKKQAEVEGLTRKPLANNGLCVRYKSREIRVLKSDDGDVPVPGPSQKRRDFYQQSFPNWDEVTGHGESDPLNLLVIWDVTRRYVFRGLELVCPKAGDLTRDSVEVYWRQNIPLPALKPRLAETQRAGGSHADDADDLPLTAKKPRTGTDNKDG